MFKVILVANTKIATEKLANKVQDNSNLEVLAGTTPRQLSKILKQYKPDAILVAADYFLHQAEEQPSPQRTNVSASTHHGIQLVPLSDIYYFQAEHKYVMVYHKRGELLIEDSLNSLESEFSNLFVRAHRKTLVAIDKIDELTKNAAGKYFIKLRELPKEIMVSRRQLPLVRKVILCT